MTIEVKKIAALAGHSSSIYALAPGISEQTIFSASSDKFIALWNLETLQPEKFAASFPEPIYSLCHIPEKKILLAGTLFGKIHILDLENKTEIKILQIHTAAIFDIKYDAASNCFYSAGGDGNFAVSSLETLSLLKIIKLGTAKIRSIDFNYTLNEIAIAAGDGSIHIFDLLSLIKKKTFAAHQLSANAVCYSPDGKLLLSGGRDAFLNIWLAGSYELIKAVPAHNWAIYDIVFHPNASLFATASRDKTIKIWDAATFNLLKRINKENLDSHTHSVNKLLWSTYTNYLVSAGDDRKIMVWEIKKV